MGGLGNQGGCGPPEILSRPEFISRLWLIYEAEIAYGLAGVHPFVPFGPVARGILGGGFPAQERMDSKEVLTWQRVGK